MTTKKYYDMDYKKKTIKSYDIYAKDFSQKFKDLTDLDKRPEFPRFIGLLYGRKILDLGSGSGDHALYFEQKGLDVTAVDLSSEMVKLSRYKGINTIQMDIENLEFKDNTFNGIWAVTSLLHIPKRKLRKVIDKLGKILKKDGLLYICMKEGEGERLEKEPNGSERFFSYWKEEELKKLFKDKFSLIDSEKVYANNTTFIQMFLRKK